MPNIKDAVLVIAGDPAILRFCADSLIPSQYDVVTARSGREAVTASRNYNPDAVLVDLELPGSIAAFQTIKRMHPDIAGLALIGALSTEAVLAAVEHGITGFVREPYRADALRSAVADALARCRAERESARLHALIPLNAVARSLMTTTDINVLLEQVVEVAVRETGADRASLMLLRDDHLWIEASHGLPDELIRQPAAELGEGIAGWVAREGVPLLLNADSEMPAELEDALTREEVASAVCVPLALPDRVIGVLNVTKLDTVLGYEPSAHFTAVDRDLISIVAGQAASAIENARLFRRQRSLNEELRQVTANLRALHQATTAVTSRLSLSRVLKTILDGLMGVLDGAIVALGILEPDKDTLTVYVGQPEDGALKVHNLPLSKGNGASATTPSQVRQEVQERLNALLRVAARPASVAELPLYMDNHLLGVLAIGAPNEVSEGDILRLEPLADQIAIAIATARTFERTRRAYAELHIFDRLRTAVIDATTRDLNASLEVVRGSAGDAERLREAAYELARDVATLQRLNTWRVNGSTPRQSLVQPTELLTRVVQRLKGVVTAQDQDLILNLSATPATVDVDETDLELVIATLLLEALEGGEPGGRIEVRLVVNDEEVAITVAATPPHRLWDEHPWVSTAAEDLPGGPGENGRANGLRLAQELVQPSGGRIGYTLRPPAEGGQVFTLTLPRAGRVNAPAGGRPRAG